MLAPGAHLERVARRPRVLARRGGHPARRGGRRGLVHGTSRPQGLVGERFLGWFLVPTCGPASIRRLSYISVAFYYRNLSRRITRSIRSVFLPRAFPAHQNDRTPLGCQAASSRHVRTSPRTVSISVTERKPRSLRWRGFVHFTPEWNRGSAFFSAFWLRSSVVSVLISLISDSPSIGGATDQSYVSPGLMIGACVDHKADGLGIAPPPKLSTHRLSNQLKFLSSIPLFLSFSTAEG